MNKIFVTDMDDVLVDLLSAWIRVLNFRYRKSVTTEQVKDWDMRLAYPDLTDKELYGVLNEDELWQQVKPKGDSAEYLKRIKDAGYDVFVCTATHYKNIGKKLTHCLLKYYPWLDYKDIIMCHNKAMINCQFIVDDNPENMRNSRAVRFLMDCPHNQNADESCYDYRVTSMKEVFDIVNELEKVERIYV